MGIDTRVLLTTSPSAIDLLRWATCNYTNAKLSLSDTSEDFFYLQFMDGSDHRTLTVFSNNYASFKEIYQGDFTYISMECWENSEIIIKSLLAEFGRGFFQLYDCNDEWTLFEGIDEQ